MNMIMALRYLGMMMLTGCSVGFIFTIVFILVLGFSGFQAIYALSFFGSFAGVGYFTAFYDLKEPVGEGVLC